jgi:hypothetical protein
MDEALRKQALEWCERGRSPRFGSGRITNITGAGDSLTLTILFGVKEVKIVAKYGKLERE